jgi:predicted PurR-regulated permease PerM
MPRDTASVLILLAVLLAALWLAPEAPLLGFAGVLLAIALRLPAVWLARQIGTRRWVAVLGVVGGLVLLIGLAVWFAIDPLVEQANALADKLPQSLNALRERLGTGGVGAWIAERLPAAASEQSGGAMNTAAAAAYGLFNGLGNTVFIILIGVYLAVAPRDYLNGLLSLLHPALERPARETLDECWEVLRGFLIGQGFAMVVTGTLTWIGLLLLGVPLAGVLAVITAVLGFIPYIGPLIAAMPAILLALTESPSLALWVALLFVVIQNIEGNVLTPLVQQRTADVSPVLLLLAQLLFGALFGLLGVLLAAPLAAVGQVIVRRAYVEGWLGREPAR